MMDFSQILIFFMKRFYLLYYFSSYLLNFHHDISTKKKISNSIELIFIIHYAYLIRIPSFNVALSFFICVSFHASIKLLYIYIYTRNYYLIALLFISFSFNNVLNYHKLSYSVLQNVIHFFKKYFIKI